MNDASGPVADRSAPAEIEPVLRRDGVTVYRGDCRAVMVALKRARVKVDAVVTDPPYHLVSTVKRFGGPGAAPAKAKTGAAGVYARSSRGFMGKTWDGLGDGTGIAFDAATWRACFDLLKPGGHLLAFSGTRTYHRMACAIEDAGFDIRDMVAWLYGSGFPKSHDISKAIDKAAGLSEQRGTIETTGGLHGGSGDTVGRYTGKQLSDNPVSAAAAAAWQGWGTAFKPAQEPICFARKPIAAKSVAANVIRFGTGALNIDACRVPYVSTDDAAAQRACQDGAGIMGGLSGDGPKTADELERSKASVEPFLANQDKGRWPANVVTDGGADVAAAFARFGESKSTGGGMKDFSKAKLFTAAQDGDAAANRTDSSGLGDFGSPMRFFYSAKAKDGDRLGSKHPTIKPIDLMAWLVRLVTPPGGLVLDPFAGSGTTAMACLREGFDCILIEREGDYVADIARRLEHVRGADTPLFSRET